MSDEYEYGPWVDAPDDCHIEIESHVGGLLNYLGPVHRYRIATPKPKRELVVGKWYRSHSFRNWGQCIFTETSGGYLRRDDTVAIACWHETCDIDWSTPPRDEAPE